MLEKLRPFEDAIFAEYQAKIVSDKKCRDDDAQRKTAAAAVGLPSIQNVINGVAAGETHAGPSVKAPSTPGSVCSSGFGSSSCSPPLAHNGPAVFGKNAALQRPADLNVAGMQDTKYANLFGIACFEM